MLRLCRSFNEPNSEDTKTCARRLEPLNERCGIEFGFAIAYRSAGAN